MNGHEGVEAISLRKRWRRTTMRLIVVTAMFGALVGPAATPALALPANDDFAHAIPLVGPAGSVFGSTWDATRETGEPALFGASPSVWYGWTYGGESPQSVTFGTCGSAFDTTLAVFTGTSVSSLTLVAANDDSCGLQSEVDFEALPGTTYSIQVAGFAGSRGDYSLAYPAGGISTAANSSPTVTLFGPADTDEGQTETYTYTATDPDVDPLTITESCGDNGVHIDTDAASSFDCIFPDGRATSTVEVTAHDWELGDSDSIAVTIANVAPSVGPISIPDALDPVAVGTEIQASASFTDPGIDDTHTAEWDWGDGTTPVGLVDQVAGAVSGSHTYTAPGVYTVTLTVTDDDADSGQPTFEFVVVYDPLAGFVTGAGWIESPAGALVGDPYDPTGRATFAFVSRYQRGASVPRGNTQFRFHAGEFAFNSTSYDWLVIAGARAQYKGTGTINGAGDYGFMLTATDGNLPGGDGSDKFRLRVWDKTTGDTIYDNGSQQPIEGGSIKIHKK